MIEDEEDEEDDEDEECRKCRKHEGQSWVPLTSCCSTLQELLQEYSAGVYCNSEVE